MLKYLLPATLIFSVSVSIAHAGSTPPTVTQASDTVVRDNAHSPHRNTVSVVVQNTCSYSWCPDVGERLTVHVYNQTREPQQTRFNPSSLFAFAAPAQSSPTMSAGTPDQPDTPHNPYQYEISDRQLTPLTQVTAHRQPRMAGTSGWVNHDLLSRGMATSRPEGRSLPSLDRLWDDSQRALQFERWRGTSQADVIEQADAHAQRLLPKIDTAVKGASRSIRDRVSSWLGDS